MKINQNIKIIGEKVILIPYKREHVPKYHDWMSSSELRELTASEPLTLEQEYEMQKSWLEDEDKCTFILLDKEKYVSSRNEIDAMIGDTNIFVTDRENAVGEIEIMIAEAAARRKHFGWEAVVLMLIYGIENIQIKKYQAKISIDNKPSMKMFEKLKFKEYSRSLVFNEITYEMVVCQERLKWLRDQL